MISVVTKEVKNIPLIELFPADKATEKLPLVIFYHGWLSYKENVLTHGYALAKQGFRVLLPEAYLHGERSEKKLTNADGIRFWEIVQKNLQEFLPLTESYIRQNLVDENRIGVTGLSMGGITTCAMLTQFKNIKAAAVLMGSPSPVDYTKFMIETQLPKDMALPKAMLAKLDEQLAKIDLSLQPEKIAHRPLYFWHGTADSLVPYKPTKLFYDKIQLLDYAENVIFVTTEGAGHKVPYPISVEMSQFFAKNL